MWISNQIRRNCFLFSVFSFALGVLQFLLLCIGSRSRWWDCSGNKEAPTVSAIEIDAQTTTHIDLNFEIKVNVSVQRNIINIMIVIKLNGSARIAHTHSSAHGESYDFDFNTIGIYAVLTSTRQTFFFVCCYLLLVFCYLLQYFIQIWCTCVFDHTWSYADAFKDAIETFNGKKTNEFLCFPGARFRWLNSMQQIVQNEKKYPYFENSNLFLHNFSDYSIVFQINNCIYKITFCRLIRVDDMLTRKQTLIKSKNAPIFLCILLFVFLFQLPCIVQSLPSFPSTTCCGSSAIERNHLHAAARKYI